MEVNDDDPLSGEATRFISSAIDPVPGGSVSEYASFCQEHGKRAFLSSNQKHLWVAGSRGELMRFPTVPASAPDRVEMRELLKKPKTYVVSYALEPNDTHPANAFSYECAGTDYSLKMLPSKSRKHIRRGFRNVRVRLCTWREVLEKGFEARVDTDVRHGKQPPERRSFKNFVSEHKDKPFFDFYGAWENDNLVAWVMVTKVGAETMSSHLCAQTTALRLGVNNALRYAELKHLLTIEKRRMVSSGMSGFQILKANELSLHENKLSMGYEAVPVHRQFVLHPGLAPFIGSKAISRVLDGLAGVFPNSYLLPRLAALSRGVSGRMQDPFAWARRPE